MAKIDPFMKPEMDEFGHPVHYVAKHAPFAMELIKQLGKDYKLQ